MTYTAEQLRRDAVAIERMHGETLTVEWRDHQAGLLRAFADALEENARLRAELGKFSDRNGYALRQRAESAEAELAKLRTAANDDDALRERMANILTRTAAALKGEPGPLTLHDWSGLPEIAERAASDLAKLRQHAEAMAKELESIRDLDGWYFQSVTDLVRAFRADFPEEK